MEAQSSVGLVCFLGGGVEVLEGREKRNTSRETDGRCLWSGEVIE